MTGAGSSRVHGFVTKRIALFLGDTELEKEETSLKAETEKLDGIHRELVDRIISLQLEEARYRWAALVASAKARELADQKELVCQGIMNLRRRMGIINIRRDKVPSIVYRLDVDEQREQWWDTYDRFLPIRGYFTRREAVAGFLRRWKIHGLDRAWNILLTRFATRH